MGASVKIAVFFFNDPATTEIYTLSLHDALPICGVDAGRAGADDGHPQPRGRGRGTGVIVGRHDTHPVPPGWADRKSTRLNSSHANISYAVFCLKKKKQHHGRPAHRRTRTKCSKE